MGSLLKVFLSGYLVTGLISCDDSGGGSSSQKSSPEFKITLAPPITLANRDAYEIAGTCTIKGEIITVAVGVLESVEATCDEDYQWQVTVNTSSINTGDLLSITATEADTLIELDVKRDTTPPQVGIDDDQAIMNSINQRNYRIAGTCDEVDGEVVLDVEGVEVKAICDGSEWTTDSIDLSGLGEAVVQVSVTADLKDKLGNPAQQATETLARDIIAPAIPTITTSAAINGESINSYSLSGGCAEDGTAAVTVKVAGLSDQIIDCASQRWEFNVPLSELNKLPEQQGIALIVEHRDSAGNVSSTSGTVDKDTVPPDIAITSGLVINIANQNSYQLAGDCSENGSEVSIILESNSPVSTSCSNARWTHSPDVEEGSFSVRITHSDAAGNTATLDPAPVLVKDVTRPEFSFDTNLHIDGANANRYHVSGSCNERGTVTVTVEGLGNKTATCNGEIWRTPPFDTASITSPDTAVELSATMVDVAGNAAGSSAITKTVGKDTSGHAVQIDRLPGVNQAPPINRDNAAAYPVSGTCSSHSGAVIVVVGTTPTTQAASSATDDCSSDGQWSVTVNVPETISDGPAIAIEVGFGSGDDMVTDATTALKDTVVPTLAMTPPPISSLNQGSYSFTGTCTGGHGPVEVTVGTIDTQGDCAGGVWRVDDLDVESLDGSSVTITADVEDAAGNPANQLSQTVDRDVEVPTVAITSADDINLANKDSYTLEGTCSEDTREVSVTIGSLPPETVTCSSGLWSLQPDTTAIPPGVSAIVVGHKDAIGNEGRDDDDTITKDIVAPVVEIASDHKVNSINQNAFPINGSCEGSETVTVLIGGTSTGDTVKIARVPCSAGVWEYTADLGSGYDEGRLDLVVTQTDALGNEGRAEQQLVKDITPPTIGIITPDDMNAANALNYHFIGTCSDSGASVSVVVAGNIQLPDVICSGTNWGVSSREGIFVNLDDGPNIAVVVTITDDHGNLARAETTFNKDTTPPAVGIDTPVLATDGNAANYSVAGSCSDGDGVVTVNVDETITPSPPTCESGRWSTTVDVSGFKRRSFAMTASQTDSFGNTGNAEQSGFRQVDGTNFLLATISTGQEGSCALKPGGEVWCWGMKVDQHGVIEEVIHPVAVVDGDGSTTPLSGIVQISSGNLHTCALKSDGGVLCWGDGSYGQLGNDGTADKDHPVAVVDGDGSTTPLSGIVQLSLGNAHTCALKLNGGVLCWGTGSSGLLGNDGEADKDHPVAVVNGDGSTTPLSGIVQISSGDAHTCALKSDGGVLCWGVGSSGQLGNDIDKDDGNGVFFATDHPVAVVGEDTDNDDNGNGLLDGITQISSGGSHTCALKSDGGVLCWGEGGGGRLGNDGGDADKDHPVAVVDGNGSTTPLRGIVQISLGIGHTCALKSDGGVLCWGTGSTGQLGNDGEVNKDHPVPVIEGHSSTTPLSDITQISSKDYRTCALKSDGKVLCWGAYSRKDLRTGTVSYPFAVVDENNNANILGMETFQRSYDCFHNGSGCALNSIFLALGPGVSSPTGNTNIDIAASGIGAGQTVHLYKNSCPGTSVGGGSIISDGLALDQVLYEGTYRYYVTVTDAGGTSACSRNSLTYIYDTTAPATPGISLVTTSPGTDTTPDVNVSVSAPGDLINIYSDSTCATVAALPVHTNALSTSVTVSALTGAGPHSFYAKATDAAGNESECSTATDGYTVSESL